MVSQHISVLLRECIDNLNIDPSGIYIDGTLGGGGHAGHIGKRLKAEGHLIGIDRDEIAITRAKQHLDSLNLACEVSLIRNHFSNLQNILTDLDIDKVNGVLFDLGVSSYQLDEVDRGFSYMQDGPLDMRMDRRETLSAKDVVNTYSEEELTWLLRTYGEEKWAKRIASFIVRERSNNPIVSSGRLVEIIKNAIPAKARKDGPHPAKRTFQAIRMEVNQELQQIERMLEIAVDVLLPKGRICVISFHSLEDRLVKNAFRKMSISCICPPEFPVCRCEHEASLKLITRKPIIPTDQETEENPRARSAKLRVAERI